MDTQTSEKTFEKKFSDVTRRFSDKEPDINTAANQIIKHLRSDQELTQGCFDSFVRTAVIEKIMLIRHEHRGALKAAITTRGVESFSAVTEFFAHSYKVNFLDRWIVGSKKLGDCSGNELKPHAEQERKQAAGNLANANFYDALASKCGNEIVRKVVNNRQVADMWNQVKNKATSTVAIKKSKKAAAVAV